MLFSKKPLLVKKRAAKVAFQMAEVVDAVDKLIELKAAKIELGAFYIYPEILQAAHDRKAYVKNVFMYCRLKEILSPGQVLYIKNIETGVIIAQYINEKALLFI